MHPTSRSPTSIPILLQEFLAEAASFSSFVAKISDPSGEREDRRGVRESGWCACMGLDVGEIGMPLDLGLDLKLFVSRTAGRLAAKEPPAVDACIRGLEEERRKIEVFRRELPLCVRLLAEVIEFMKEEAAKRAASRDAAAKADDNDKRKWMSTAQLWVDSRASDADPVVKERQNESALHKPMLLAGGAPVPSMAVGFGAMPPPPPPTTTTSQFFIRDDKVATAEGLPVLPMMSSRPFSPAAAGDDRRHAHGHPAKFATAMPPPGLSLQTQEQQSRKTRRCWSTELHRQFVAALRQLGGPQVATPKQIREVMKVDGLTNDEVKSHLQVSNKQFSLPLFMNNSPFQMDLVLCYVCGN
uniref:Uncharacterized protein n=1 Tax=Avena sativa TaxID=4498 RepID=A0ACD6A848_AVESA